MEEKNLEKIWSEFTELLQHGNNSYPEFFYHYCRHLHDRQVFQKYVLNVKYLFELAKRPIRGAKILDVGCGFGVDCMIMAALGAREVHGIDVNQTWVATIQKYLKELKWDLPIKTRQGDASRIPYPDNTFDILLSVEAISHYRDVDNFLLEAHRVLNQGGLLIISDANNGANPLIRSKTYQIWDRFENGPPAENFHSHRIEKPYRQMRKEIIVEAFPQLSEKQAERLAENTFGMGREEIVAASERYVKEGVMPESKFRPRVPALNPEKNDYIERLFDPRELSKQMRKIGFDVRAYAHFGGAGEKNLIGKLNSMLRVLSPVTMFGARAYKIVATKN